MQTNDTVAETEFVRFETPVNQTNPIRTKLDSEIVRLLLL